MAGVAIACLLAGCGHASLVAPLPPGPPLPLSTAQLPPYTATYTASGTVNGTLTWTVTAPSNGQITVSIHQSVGGAVEDDTVVLQSKGLGFVSAKADSTAQNKSVSISAHAVGNEIIENADLNGLKEAKTLPLSANTVVNVALLPTLAGIDVAPGQRQTISDLVLEQSGATTLDVSTGPTTTVKTPAGTFRCVPITLSGTAGTQTACVDPTNHVLVRYIDGSGMVVTLNTLSAS